ncbi:hypothetical protein [Streptomyces sp. NPDC005009]
MRTTVLKVSRAVTAVVGAVLAAGCGDVVAPSAPPAVTSSAASFGQKGVQTDLDAAIAAAGLPAGRTEAGFPLADRTVSPGTTDKKRKLLALSTRLSPCIVFWSPDETDNNHAKADSAEMRRQLDEVLTQLVARGWKETEPSEEAPVGDDGTLFMASYKKQGWILNAQHSSMPAWTQSKAIATKESCFDRVTDEERALIED